MGSTDRVEPPANYAAHFKITFPYSRGYAYDRIFRENNYAKHR